MDFEFGDKIAFDIQRHWGERETLTIEGLFLGKRVARGNWSNDHKDRVTLIVALDRENHCKMQIQGPWEPDRPMKFELDRCGDSMNFRKVEN